MGQEGCHGNTTEVFSRVQTRSGGDARRTRGDGESIAAELGIGANVLGRWRREVRRQPPQAFVGNGRARDEELSHLRRELARDDGMMGVSS